MHEVIFDEETHTYYVDGIVKPSVTSILKSAGIIEGYDGIPEYYRDRGTRAHDACTLAAQGFLDWESVDEDIEQHVKNFVYMFSYLKLEYVSSETPCYDEELECCGKFDIEAAKENGKRVLVELKTGVFPMWGGLQCAAYKRMMGADSCVGLELKDGGKIYVESNDFHLNESAWVDIRTGMFDLDTWKGNRKRRYMQVLK